MKKINIKLVLYYLVALIGLSASAAFQMKINFGLGPWDALGRSLHYISGLKVGDVAILLNSSCVLIQFLLLRKNFKLKHAFPVLVAFINGKFTNFFYYTVYDGIEFNNLILIVVLFVLSVVFIAFFVSMIQTADIVDLPLEGLCQTVEDIGYGKFAKNRTIVDVISVVLVFMIVIFLKQPSTLGAGTIIMMLMFGPLLGVYEKIQNKFLEKYVR